MGFADTGKLGVAVRPRVYSDRLPKNVAQPGLEGKNSSIGGVNPTIFNLGRAPARDHDLNISNACMCSRPSIRSWI